MSIIFISKCSRRIKKTKWFNGLHSFSNCYLSRLKEKRENFFVVFNHSRLQDFFLLSRRSNTHLWINFIYQQKSCHKVLLILTAKMKSKLTRCLFTHLLENKLRAVNSNNVFHKLLPQTHRIKQLSVIPNYSW